MHKGLENINLPLRGFVRRLFYVSNVGEFSFCRKRQYSYNERNALKLRGNCERNFDGAFPSSFEIFFSGCITDDECHCASSVQEMDVGELYYSAVHFEESAFI